MTAKEKQVMQSLRNQKEQLKIADAQSRLF